MDRRTFVRTSAWIGAATGVSMGAIPGTAAAGPNASVIFYGQMSDDGTTIVVDQISTEVAVSLGVRNRDTDENLASIDIEPGTYEDYEVELDPPVTEPSEILVSLYPEDGGESYDHDVATVGPDTPAAGPNASVIFYGQMSDD